MRFRPVSIVVVAAPLAAVLLLAGCSSAGTSGATSSSSSTSTAPKASATKAAAASKPVPSNPCDLLPVAEASKAVGTTFSKPYRAGNACSYDQEDHGFILTVYTQGNLSWQAAEVGMKTQFGKTPAISGLGDRAIGTGGFLDVQSGSTVIDIADNYADKDPQLAHATAIAKIVLSNL